MSVTADDVDGLSYGELQRRCKELGISARGKREELARRLLELDEVTPNSPPVSSLLRNGSQASATPVPSTSTRPSSTVTPRRRPAPALSDLAEALSTPLPPPRPPSAAEHDTPAVPGTLSRPPRGGSTLLKLLATFAVLGVLTAVAVPLAEKHGLLRTQDLFDRAHAVWDPLAARAQRTAAAARAETEAAVSRAKTSAAATWQQGETCVRRHLGGAPAALRRWFVTVPATYLHRARAAPASLWRRAAIGRRLGAARASLRPRLAATRSAVERHVLALKSNVLERVRAARERIAELTAKKKETPAVVEDAAPAHAATPDEAPSPAAAQEAAAQEPAATQPPPNCALSMEALSRVVTPSATWQGALEDLREMLVGEKPDARKHQANVLTLAYGSEEERVKNFGAFFELAKPNCIAFVDAWSVTEPGELQKRLAEYLRWEPTAIVAVQLIELMSPRVLPVLINGMSEGGGFEYDGFVPSKDATFVLTTRVPHEWLATPDTHAFEHSTKEAVAYGLQAHPDAAATEGTPAMLAALRRRIDAVLAAGDLAPVVAAAVADEEEEDDDDDDESSDDESEAEVAPEVVEEPSVTMPDSAEEAAAAIEQQGAGADAELLDLEAVLAEDPEVMERFIAGLESGDSENVLEWDGVASDGAFPGDARSPEEIAQDLGHWDPDDSFKRPGADDLEGLPQAAQ